METDYIRPVLVARYHSYGFMFEKMFSMQPITIECTVYNVVDGCYPPENECWDAYLVTGSKADSFANDAWIKTLKEYLNVLFCQGKILLGICFGHQLLALILGGKVERASQGLGLGSHSYIICQKEKWMVPVLDRIALFTNHQDQVTVLPRDATLIAKSVFCPNAAFIVGKQVLCFQGHPEFVLSYMKIILESRREQLGKELYDRAIESLSTEHQGIIIAQWMVRFIEEGKFK